MADRYQTQPGVDEVKTASKEVKKLLSATSLIRTAFIVIFFLLLAASLFLIVNTIRLATFAPKTRDRGHEARRGIELVRPHPVHARRAGPRRDRRRVRLRRGLRPQGGRRQRDQRATRSSRAASTSRVATPTSSASTCCSSAPRSASSARSSGCAASSRSRSTRSPAGLRDPTEVRLLGLPTLGELLLRGLVADRAADDHVATLLPVRRGGHAVARRELE